MKLPMGKAVTSEVVAQEQEDDVIAGLQWAADVLHGHLQQQDGDWDGEVKHLLDEHWHDERVCGGSGVQDACSGG
jgi:hypothetical protein